MCYSTKTKTVIKANLLIFQVSLQNLEKNHKEHDKKGGCNIEDFS